MRAWVLVAVLATLPAAAAEIPPGERRSGYDQMKAETRAMQDDDASNPGMLWVLDGEALWSRKTGSANAACVDCHGDARDKMKGTAARYPVFDAARGRPIDLEEQINICRVDRQNAPPLERESRDLLALTAYIGRQSRGMPLADPTQDARLRPFIEAGRATYERRQGQLNLACGQCHDDNWGRQLAGNALPQAHPTGYPLYRLEWQAVGSLQRRLRNCMIGIRAEPYAYGAKEYVELQLYLNWRARGMPMETPAVRP